MGRHKAFQVIIVSPIGVYPQHHGGAPSKKKKHHGGGDVSSSAP
jgi:hypothetical protein